MLPCSTSAGTVRSRYIYVAYKGVWGLATNKQNAKWLSLCPACKGLLKPNAVFFGESIPREAFSRANEEVQQCRVMLVVGTSGIVEPVASLPLLAKSNGAFIIEINPEPSYLTSSVTTLFLQGKAEEILPEILEKLTS